MRYFFIFVICFVLWLFTGMAYKEVAIVFCIGVLIDWGVSWYLQKSNNLGRRFSESDDDDRNLKD